MRPDSSSVLPCDIEEQAVRPIGVDCGNAAAPDKVFPDVTSTPRRNYFNQSMTSGSLHGVLEEFGTMVYENGVAFLRGSSINLSEFKSKLPAAVEAGLVSKIDSDYVLHGLEFGFDLHVDESKMKGKRVWRNFRSAYESKSKVHAALMKRVASGKTARLGEFHGKSSDLPGDQGCTVPQGAVPKRLEPDAARPFSDHTKTGFNAACDVEFLKHSLDTYNEISAELRPGYFMRVEDIDGAYPLLPLHPSVWKYMYVWWFDTERPLEEQTEPNTLYVHLFADFGTAALPGIWDKFFRCLKAMAVLEGVLTLPMPHFVDDNSLIGPDPVEVDSVAEKVGEYFAKCGVSFKELKSRHAAVLQLVLGFWWDSVARTRTLESEKLEEYLAHFEVMARRKVITLHELQVTVGRMHRAVMTMPKGSNVFLARLIALTRGLKLPWHKKRVPAGVRADIRAIIRVLRSNHGRGYFDTSHLPWAPDVYTDAMKDSTVAGWGWVSMCGAYDFGTYGSSWRHRPIDELEGDTVRKAASALGAGWRGKRVRIWCDNSAFTFSLLKHRSRVERLNDIIRSLHELSVQYDCVFVPTWISTHDNIGADALSRNEFEVFRSWYSNISHGNIDLHRSSHVGL